MPLFWLSLAFVAGLVFSTPALWAGEREIIRGENASQWVIWGLFSVILIVLSFVELRLTRNGLHGHRLGLPAGKLYAAWRQNARLPLTLVLAFFFFGGLRSVTSQPAWTESDLAWYIQKAEYRFTGIVQQPPSRNQKVTNLVVAVDRMIPMIDGELTGESLPVRGQVWVSLRGNDNWRYGDRLEMQGILLEPGDDSADFFREYLGRKDIYTELNFPEVRLLERDAGSPFWAWLFDLRALFERTLRNLLPQPEAGLLIGILLGSANSLPVAVAQSFRNTGIAHIIAVSGFNIAIIAALFVKTLGRLFRARYAVPLAMIGIAAYTLLTGASPSVVRAAIMGIMGLLGPLAGRRQVGVNSLVFTAGSMCLLNPQLPGDVSFQLSFAATLGLVLYAEPLQAAFTRLSERWLAAPLARRLAGPVGEYFLFTLAAQIFTLPVTAVHFQRISLSAGLVNPLVLPVQPLAMILGGVALLLGLAFAPLGQLVGLLCWPLLAYTIRVAELLSDLPYGELNLGRLAPGLVVLVYVVLIVLAVPDLRRLLRLSWKPTTALVLAGLLAVSLWRLVLAAPDGRLRLDVLNLPGGPIFWIRSPNGQTWLINSSSQSDDLADALGRRISPLDDYIDGLILTERAASSLTGITSLVETYPPRLAGLSRFLPDTTNHKRLTARLKGGDTQVIRLEPGLTFDLGQGTELRTLADTRAGTALWLERQGFRAFFPGGISLSDMPRPLPAGVTLLVLTPLDLQYLPLADWADQFQPVSLLVTAGPSSGLPGEMGLEAYQWISFQAQDSQLWIEGVKK